MTVYSKDMFLYQTREILALKREARRDFTLMVGFSLLTLCVGIFVGTYI